MNVRLGAALLVLCLVFGCVSEPVHWHIGEYPLPILTTGAGANNWTDDGHGGVYWTENNYTISAFPKTNRELINHYQYINFTSTNPANILTNLSFVFDQKPLSGDVLLWQNKSHQVQVPHTTRMNATYQINGVVNYTASVLPCQIGDAQNIFNYNVSYASNNSTSSIIACFDSYTNISNNYTLTYSYNGTTYTNETQYWMDWGSIIGNFDYTNITTDKEWRNVSHQVPHVVRENYTAQINGVTSYVLSESPCQIGDVQNALKYNVSFSQGNNSSSLIACFNSYTNISDNYTLFYQANQTVYEQEWWYEWVSITPIIHHIYTINNVPFNGSTNYQTKFLYSFPVTNIGGKFGSSGKFDIYAHTLSPRDVINGSATVYVQLDPWWNASYTNRFPINCTNITTGEIFEVNGTNGFIISGGATKQYVVTQSQANLYIYYNNETSWTIATETAAANFHVISGNVSSVNANLVYNQTGLRSFYHNEDTNDATTNYNLTMAPAGKVGNTLSGLVANASNFTRNVGYLYTNTSTETMTMMGWFLINNATTTGDGALNNGLIDTNLHVLFARRLNAARWVQDGLAVTSSGGAQFVNDHGQSCVANTNIKNSSVGYVGSGGWFFAAVAWNATRMRSYANTTQLVEMDISSSGSSCSTGAAAEIGGFDTNAPPTISNSIDGKIDWVYVYNTSLSTAAINLKYTENTNNFNAVTGFGTLGASEGLPVINSSTILPSPAYNNASLQLWCNATTGDAANVTYNYTAFNGTAVYSSDLYPINTAAIGGTITTDGLYTVHKFTTTNQWFNVTGGAINATVLVVAGGGAGGGSGGGGGGAGGLIYNTSYNATGNISVIIGAGGTGVYGLGSTGGNGQNSSFGTLVANGGGGGSSQQNANPAGSGGSSGGGGGWSSGTTTAGTPTPAGQGHTGGNNAGRTGTPYPAGGGGGAGGDGQNAPSQNTSGAGGLGLNYSIDGTNRNYSCGGGAGAYDNSALVYAGAGGCSSGGNGDKRPTAGTAGAANTGGGGGGGSSDTSANLSGAGGSGIVIVRYLTYVATGVTQGINTNVANISQATLAVGQNWTLQCSAYNANGASAFLNSSVTTILSSSSCTCPASPANWTIQLRDNCNITNSCNLVGYYLIYNGTGTVTYNNSSATIKISAKGEKLTNIVAPFYEKIITMLWKNYTG